MERIPKLCERCKNIIIGKEYRINGEIVCYCCYDKKVYGEDNDEEED